MDINRAGPMLRRDTIDMHGAIAALGRNVLVKRVPGDALHVVVVFGDFVHALS